MLYHGYHIFVYKPYSYKGVFIEIRIKKITSNFDTGGWIRHDTRNQQTTAIITIKLNGEHISETRALKISYHNDKEKWGEPRWTTI